MEKTQRRLPSALRRGQMRALPGDQPPLPAAFLKYVEKSVSAAAVAPGSIARLHAIDAGDDSGFPVEVDFEVLLLERCDLPGAGAKPVEDRRPRLAIPVGVNGEEIVRDDPAERGYASSAR